MAEVKANHIPLPKAEVLSSKGNSLASVKTTQLYLLNRSNAMLDPLEDPGPWILLIFLMPMREDTATVCFDYFLCFSLLHWEN